jgi:radical SAM protein with 4Fe4S-binding SPASM domain
LLAVDPDGQVMPCHRFLYRRDDWLGAVQDDPREIRDRRGPYLELHSARLVADGLMSCEECPARGICSGGCRLVALQQGRGLNGLHPGHCITMRAHHKAIVRIYEGLRQRSLLGLALSARRAWSEGMQELMLR